MIPKIFHRIWFGDKPIPEIYEQWWAGWRRQYPDYEFRTWRDADVANLPLTAAKIAEAQGAARKSDIARYEILFTFGGIYLDCDVMPYHRYDFESESASLIVCNETRETTYCSIGFMAAEPAHNIFAEAIERLMSMNLNCKPVNHETGPWFFGSILPRHAHKRLPSEAFYPYLYNEPLSATIGKPLARTYGIHVWGSSWLDPKILRKKAVESLAAGDLQEAQLHASQYGEELGQRFGDLTSTIRQARRAALKAALHPMLADQLQIRDVAPFELLKAIDFLLKRQPDAPIWQIGAADGVLVDPLRPAMVRHDPVAVLFEPNPMLFAKLEQNYAYNDNTRLICAAVGASASSLILNAVDPALARNAGLPKWVDGISSFFDDRNALGGKTINPMLTARIQQCVVQTEVPVIDVETARQLSGVPDPEILVVDVEGMDAEVIHACLDAGLKPAVIQFETQCLPADEAASLLQRLQRNHIVIEFGNDSVAYRRDFFDAYCEALYVEHGISTIYAQALAFTIHA